MIRRLGVNGRLDPSHETIAGDAGVSTRTVRRALVAPADLGLVRWVQRLMRVDWRTAQTANAYVLAVVELLISRSEEKGFLKGFLGRFVRRS